VIYDDDDQISVVKRVLKDLDLDEKRYPARPFLKAISAAKSELVGPHQYGEFTNNYWQEVAGPESTGAIRSSSSRTTPWTSTTC
jgi:superfamily I DNA/RNA helicase